MGLLSRLFGGGGGGSDDGGRGRGGERALEYPGLGFSSPREVLVEAMRRLERVEDGWVTVEVPGCMHSDGEQIWIEALPGQVNMCRRELPAAFAHELGLTSQGDALYEAKDADPEVMGLVLDSILRSYFFQQDGYPVRCVVES